MKAVAFLHILFGGLGLLAGIIVFAIFGGIAGLVGAGAGEGAWIAAPILGAIGMFVMVLTVVLSVPGIIAGIGLLSLRPWARILTIVLAGFELLNFPFGTILGGYSLWALLSPDGERLFRQDQTLAARGQFT